MIPSATQRGAFSGLATARSCFAAEDQRQTRLADIRAHALPAVASNNARDWMASRHAGFLNEHPDLLLNLRGLNCAPHFSRNSRSDARSSRCSVRTRVCLIPLKGRPASHSPRPVGTSRSRAQSTPHQRLVHFVADPVAHLSVVLSKTSLAGFNNASKGFQKIGKVCQTGGPRD